MIHKIKGKESKTHWTEKLGGKIGKGVNKAFSNKKVKIVLTVTLLAVLFIFIVPLKNNIVTIVLLAVLFIAYFIVKQLEKKK